MRKLLRSFLVEGEAEVRKKTLTVPNLITAVGIALTAVYVYAFTTTSFTALIPVLVFIIAFSDLLDGFAARILNQHSHLGKFIDPLRDRVFGLALVLNIAIVGNSPEIIILVIMLFVPELAVAFVSLKLKRTFGKVQIHTIAKLRMAVHIVCGGVFVMQTYWADIIPSFVPRFGTVYLLAIMFIASVCAAFAYLRKLVRYF